MNKNNKIKENKIVLSKDKKIIIILSILTILLFMFGIVLWININKNQSQIRELQSQTTNLNSIISSLNIDFLPIQLLSSHNIHFFFSFLTIKLNSGEKLKPCCLKNPFLLSLIHTNNNSIVNLPIYLLPL